MDYGALSNDYWDTWMGDDPDLRDVKQNLSQALDQWMETQQDPGAPVDTPEALESARKGSHLHF
jgi:N-sulfoglucosamine sulfohydrolase